MKRLLVFAIGLAVLLVFRPTAVTAATGLDGKWHFVMDTPGGDREMDADFAVDADGKVSGNYNKTAVAGTFKEGKMDLSFEMTSEESGETAPLKLVGNVDAAGTLTGTWEFSSYSGSFKAMRPKP